MKSIVRVRGFNKRRSPVVAAARFEYDGWKTDLGFEIQAERTPGRNTLRVPDLLMQDPYNGKSDPRMGFSDTIYNHITGAQRLVLPRLRELGITGVSMASCMDEQKPGYSFLRISGDRTPADIELAGACCAVDPVELAAAGLVAAFHAEYGAQISVLLGGNS